MDAHHAREREADFGNAQANPINSLESLVRQRGCEGGV